MCRPARAAALALLVLAASTACTGIGGVDGTPGASGLRDPYFPKLGNGGYDVTHYDLVLDVDPGAHRLRGTATITARATQDLSAFNLDLAGLTVRSATVEGRPAAVNRAGHELTLRPDAGIGHRLRKGRTFRAVVRYSGSPEILTDPDQSEEGWLRTSGGAVALGEPTGAMAWFPGNNHPSDKASYDIEVTVPQGLTAVSNGELVSRTTSRAATTTGGAPDGSSGGTSTYHWRVVEPMASYLATLAVGRFDMKASSTPDGIKVFTAADTAVAARSAAVLARVPEVVAWEAERFGPYPFSATGAIVGRDGDAGYALETQNRPFFPGPPSVGLLVHEMAHQWFGNSVTPASWRDMWLNEGLATYAQWLWEDDKEGEPVEDRFEAAFYNDDNWAFPPAEPPTAADISRAPVYGRGAMVIHRIREAVGDDERFFALVQGWTRAHRHGTASTADFTAYVDAHAERATGKDLTELWDTWLYGKSRPTPKG
ncbi:M1 family metallopeptidase [Streptomyces sp. NPDC001279]|uniref:M1 family metallopeptidase n=1 Tax=Streptomyces sp. NPDC001279 TaxID=3364556 RepID=UPI0036BFF887